MITPQPMRRTSSPRERETMRGWTRHAIVIGERARPPHPHSLWTHTMNRCSRRSLLALCAAATATAALSLPAHAQALSRPFPKEALRGTLVMTQPPYLTMDDRVGRLSPGARIRNTNNTLVLSACCGW